MEQWRRARLAEFGQISRAEPLGRAGQVAEGRGAIDEALAQSEHTEERWCITNLLRIKGELVVTEGAPNAREAADVCLREALDWVRRQGALAWELRVARSLGRLWHAGAAGPVRHMRRLRLSARALPKGSAPTI